MRRKERMGVKQRGKMDEVEHGSCIARVDKRGALPTIEASISLTLDISPSNFSLYANAISSALHIISSLAF